MLVILEMLPVGLSSAIMGKETLCPIKTQTPYPSTPMYSTYPRISYTDSS
jgi:hypothetical protein